MSIDEAMKALPARMSWGTHHGEPGYLQRETPLYEIIGTEGWISEREYLRRAQTEKLSTTNFYNWS